MIEHTVDKKNDIKKSHMDSALGTALHILRCIDEGQSRKEIIQSLDNNEQLVSVWIQYLKAISWLNEDTKGKLVTSEDGKLWIHRYDTTSSKLKDTNIISRKHDSDKNQQEIVNSFKPTFAKFMEITVMSCWSYYWRWILPVTNRMAEAYAVSFSILLDNTRAVNKAANEALSAIRKY
jgi:transposase